MDDIALAAMDMSAARLEMQYAMSLQKRTMGELAMLPPTPSLGDYIDTYA